MNSIFGWIFTCAASTNSSFHKSQHYYPKGSNVSVYISIYPTRASQPWGIWKINHTPINNRNNVLLRKMRWNRISISEPRKSVSHITAIQQPKKFPFFIHGPWYNLLIQRNKIVNCRKDALLCNEDKVEIEFWGAGNKIPAVLQVLLCGVELQSIKIFWLQGGLLFHRD